MMKTAYSLWLSLVAASCSSVWVEGSSGSGLGRKRVRAAQYGHNFVQIEDGETKSGRHESMLLHEQKNQAAVMDRALQMSMMMSMSMSMSMDMTGRRELNHLEEYFDSRFLQASMSMSMMDMSMSMPAMEEPVVLPEPAMTEPPATDIARVSSNVIGGSIITSNGNGAKAETEAQAEMQGVSEQEQDLMTSTGVSNVEVMSDSAASERMDTWLASAAMAVVFVAPIVAGL